MNERELYKRLLEAEMRLSEIRANLAHLRDGLAVVIVTLSVILEEVEPGGDNDERDKRQ